MTAALARRLAWRRDSLAALPPPPVSGRLTRMVGLTLEAVGVRAAVGEHCNIELKDGSQVEAEVVGFSADRLYLMPCGAAHGLEAAAAVMPTRRSGVAPVGQALLGRVIDGAARPLDGLGPLQTTAQRSLSGTTINPLQRAAITLPLDVGVRAHDKRAVAGMQIHRHIAKRLAPIHDRGVEMRM